MHARVYACACACVCVCVGRGRGGYHRYEGVAWRNAMLERAQQHDESWNGSLVPPRTLLSITGIRSSSFSSTSLSLSFTSATTSVLLSFSLFARSFATPLALSLFFPLRVFLALAYSLAFNLPLSIYLSISVVRFFPLFPGQHMDAILARAPKGRSAVVGEWTNALSAPAAEIKRTGRFLLFPAP